MDSPENVVMSNDEKPRLKDVWYKWEIILAPAGGLLTALAVGFFTLYSSWRVGKWQKTENEARDKLQQVEVNTRLFTELMGRREEAETSLRKEMFKSILDAFLNRSAAESNNLASESLEPEVLKMELLAYNFH